MLLYILICLSQFCLNIYFPPHFFVSLFILFWLLQDLPALYLQGGAIIPVGPPHQHLGESNQLEDLTLLVALDEDGNCSVNFLWKKIGLFGCK